MHTSFSLARSSFRVNRKLTSSFVIVIALLAGCNKDETQQHATPVATTAKSICDYDEALQEGVKGISKQDAESICRTMSAKLGRDPSPRLLATMQRFLFGIRANFGFNDSAANFTEQMMEIIEGRRQLGSEEPAMIQTLNVAAKCFSGSQGRVTPKAIAAAIRAAGNRADTLSDDGMYSMCAMIDVNLGGSQ